MSKNVLVLYPSEETNTLAFFVKTEGIVLRSYPHSVETFGEETFRYVLEIRRSWESDIAWNHISTHIGEVSGFHLTLDNCAYVGKLQLAGDGRLTRYVQWPILEIKRVKR